VVDDFSATVTWGPTAWRTAAFTASVSVPTAAPVVSTGGQTTCPGFLPSRLSLGQQGRVTDANNVPNNVRSDPSSGSERIGQIPAGDVFQIIGGPICAENTTWWQVRYRTTTGWTAEGANGEYWLEPFTTPAPSSQAQSYIVQRGDILARIAQQFDVPVSCIIQTNNLTDPNRLLPDQVLVIDPLACS
jgi:LysM repeat protein